MHPPSFWWLLRGLNTLTLPIPLWAPNHFAVYLLPYKERAPYEHSSVVTQSCPTLCDPMDCSNHLIRCHPLLFLPSILPSIRVFSNESALCIRWPKYWSFSFNTSPSNEHPGLISFRMDWLDLLAVQGTLKSLNQHHSSKASILRCSAFFIV